MREFFRHIFSRTNLFLYVIGLAAIIVCMYLTPVPGSGGPLIPAPWYVRPLEPLGYTLIITTLVAAGLNFSFQSSIEARFSIVKGAEGAGILRLFATRADAIDRIADQAERANNVMDILCVSGTSLFHRECRVLAEIGRRYKNKSSIKIRVLILDPRSHFAIERSLREEGFGTPNSNTGSRNYPDFHLCHDTLDSLRQLEKVLKPSTSSGSVYSCEVRLYNSAPVAMYVCLDDRVFIEQYHYGIPRAQLGTPFTVCLGKAVPVVESTAASELGHVMGSTFDYLWEWSQHRELRQGDTKRLRDSLANGDWLARFEASENEEQKLLKLSDPPVQTKPEQTSTETGAV